MKSGSITLSCSSDAATGLGFGPDGLFRAELHDPGICTYELHADFGGHWYSARGTLRILPGHAYEIQATLAPRGFFVAFPFESY